jgi:chloramphenicol 3-O-phosphotransferase
MNVDILFLNGTCSAGKTTIARPSAFERVRASLNREGNP